MTFVTCLRLTSGDRAALDGVTDRITSRASRKGVALKGPHALPHEQLRVPLLKRIHDESESHFSSWTYRVYVREIEIHGHESFARSVAEVDYPSSVRLEATVEQIH